MALKAAINMLQSIGAPATHKSWSSASNATPAWEAFCRLTGTAALCVALLFGIMQSDNSSGTEEKPSAASSDTQSRGNTHSSDSLRDGAIGREWMIGAYAGLPYTYQSDVRAVKKGSHDFTVKDVTWDGEPFEDPIYYGVRVVRWPDGGRFGTMLDFIHSKAIADREKNVKTIGEIAGQPAPESSSLKTFYERLEFSHGHNMLTVNGLIRLGMIAPRVWPYIGLGFGVSLPHTEVQLQTEQKRTYEYQYAGPTAQGLVGLEVRLNRISYFVEYKFTIARYAVPLTRRDGSEIGLFADLYFQAQRWWRGEEPPGGWVETELDSHQVITGAGVRIPR